jgi:hypothetical protein
MDFCCKAQLVGIDHFVRCLEEPPSRCSFSVPMGSAYLCQFPLFKNHDKESKKMIQEDLSITMEH